MGIAVAVDAIVVFVIIVVFRNGKTQRGFALGRVKYYGFAQGDAIGFGVDAGIAALMFIRTPNDNGRR